VEEATRGSPFRRASRVGPLRRASWDVSCPALQVRSGDPNSQWDIIMSGYDLNLRWGGISDG